MDWMYGVEEAELPTIERLDENTIHLEFTTKEKNELFQWAKAFKMTTEELEKSLSQRAWRKSLKKTNI